MLIFLTLLAGAVNATPVNLVYFLEADTSDIPGAPSAARWTLWNLCGVSGDGLDQDCRPVSAAYPFDPPNNFGTTDGVPDEFVG